MWILILIFIVVIIYIVYKSKNTNIAVQINNEELKPLSFNNNPITVNVQPKPTRPQIVEVDKNALMYNVRSFFYLRDNSKWKSKSFIVFDLETNGLYSRCSVLSIGAIKYEYLREENIIKEISRLNRFYYPKSGNFDPEACAVNGLSESIINANRAGQQYPEYFSDDSDVVAFFQDIDGLVGHNISFDLKFINFIPETIKTFCTMNVFRKAFNGLPYKLYDVADYFKFDYNKNNLHNSIYDAELTSKIFFKICNMAYGINY